MCVSTDSIYTAFVFVLPQKAVYISPLIRVNVTHFESGSVCGCVKFYATTEQAPRKLGTENLLHNSALQIHTNICTVPSALILVNHHFEQVQRVL